MGVEEGVGASGEVAGKISAPVTIEGSFDVETGAGTADLTFLAPAEDVRVRWIGTRGLTVESDPVPIRRGSFVAGEGIDLPVSFQAPEGQSHIALLVKWKFHGVLTRSRAVTFTVGELTMEQIQARRANIVRGPGGELRHELQAQP